MLSENIRAIRESKGLSQEELATKLRVVRQTVSKWERGRSVPDADLLIALAEALGVSVGTLLGETVQAPEPDELSVIAEKLEIINMHLARRAARWRAVLLCLFAAVFVLTVLTLIGLGMMGSSYLSWDFSDPETAIAATALHAFEWVFVRVAPFALVGSAVGFSLVWKRGRAS